MSKPMSRRAILRGMGAAMALPWLDAMQVTAAAPTVDVPKRLAFIFVPNGVHLPNWTPQRVGYDYDLPQILEPLRSVKSKVNVLSGLTHDKGRANGDGPGDHARSASVFLTGAQPKKTSGANIRVGISVDQLAAQQLGHLTRFKSLELGCEKGQDAGNCDSGYSCAYSSNISWASPSTPVGKETNPRAVFDRLFASQSTQENRQRQWMQDSLKKSVLDFVNEDARRLRERLGSTDKRKLDEYLTGVREIERRIEMQEQESVARSVSGLKRPDGIPADYAQHLRLMCDMMVLAFQTDLTRISTFMFANAGSNRPYRDIGVPDGHHSLSHHGGDQVKLDKISKINHFHMVQFSYLLQRLNAIPEGNGTLLDNCMIMYGSGISDGNRHNNEDLPILLAGGGGGEIRSGRHIVYPRETPTTNLFLALLDRMGVQVDAMGDCTGRLSQLS